MPQQADVVGDSGFVAGRGVSDVSFYDELAVALNPKADVSAALLSIVTMHFANVGFCINSPRTDLYA
jgi:hypothetical protein